MDYQFPPGPALEGDDCVLGMDGHHHTAGGDGIVLRVQRRWSSTNPLLDVHVCLDWIHLIVDRGLFLRILVPPQHALGEPDFG